jgi:hypothetical protein
MEAARILVFAIGRWDPQRLMVDNVAVGTGNGQDRAF